MNCRKPKKQLMRPECRKPLNLSVFGVKKGQDQQAHNPKTELYEYLH
jgi:hypothetical protein